MKPGLALGAILRSKQTVVVGDTNQMPPDTTFMTNNNDDDDEEIEDYKTTDESILEMSNKVFQCNKNNLILAPVILANVRLSISVTRLE